MIQLIKNLFFWGLDYWYVFKEQIASVLSRSKPSMYRNKNGQPVILIPGIYENWRFMRPVARLLYLNGYDVHIIEDLGFNRGTIEEMATYVETYIAAQHLTGVTLVAHSKGGLIGKYVLSTITTLHVLRGLITLNTPFSGSKYARFLPLKSLRIFIPSSPALLGLAKDTLVNSRIVSLYGIFDPHIPGGSLVDGAKNIQLPVYGHFRIMNSVVVHDAILENIDSRKESTS